MQLLIDLREPKTLVDYIISLNETSTTKITIVQKNLTIGDYVFYDEVNAKELLIIERKSLSDLEASIKDGRYNEQSFRLNECSLHNHNIIYLLEGAIIKYNPKFRSTLYSSLFSLNYYKGFSVFRSFSLAETATIICNMAYKLTKETKEAFYHNHIAKNKQQQPILEQEQQQQQPILEQEQERQIEEHTEKDYVSVIKKVKKENITPDNIGEIMLCQIPGISSVTALTIMEKFKTLPNLIKELDINADCLKDISSINAKGQSRKINKTSISNIVKFLLKK